MSKGVNKFAKYSRVVWLVAVIAVLFYLIATHLKGFGYAIIVMIGFGAMIMVHELGHFIMAKLGDIHVEAFSIGMPPYFMGIKRTEQGVHIRILPGFLPVEQDSDDDGSVLKFTIGPKDKQGETEYRVGMIPFGGFVKMLGQEDTKKVETNDNPRSYANKSVWIRMRVIAAGVILNTISAFLLFIGIYMHGITSVPPIVGSVIPGSVAEQAGLMPGDEIVEIAGNDFMLDFGDIKAAGVFAGPSEKIKFKILRDAQNIELGIVPREVQTETVGRVKQFGIEVPFSTKIAKVDNPQLLYDSTGLKIGDEILSVNGQQVKNASELFDKIKNVTSREVPVIVERGKDGESEKFELDLGITMGFDLVDPNSESSLSHIYSILPLLKVSYVADTAYDKKIDDQHKLKAGDVIVAVGEIEYPSYKELRDITNNFADKELSFKVSRKDANGVESIVSCKAYPKKSKSDRVVIGVGIEYDADNAVVAKTIKSDGVEKLDIPRGAVITAVDGEPVGSFYDVINIIRKNEFCGQRISVDYRIDDDIAGGVSVDPAKWTQAITVQMMLSDFVPLAIMERLYKADSGLEAVKIGCVKTKRMLFQAVTTLKMFLSGQVSAKGFLGPVGILKTSYQIVKERPLIDFFNWIAMISIFIAVMNSLPILPFDGGHVVILAIEKFRGKPVDERVQAGLAYVGLFLVLVLILYITYYDFLR